MRRWAPLLAAAAWACASAERGPDFATSASFPEVPRKPPSFAAEPAGAGLEPTSAGLEPINDAAAFATRRAVVPLDSEAARELVSRFFIAVLQESNRDLVPLLATQAWVISEGNRQPAQGVWRARFAQLDYTSLSGRIVAAPQTLRTYTYDTRERAKRDGVPAPQATNEVVVVARPSLSWAGKTRLFGDALAFRLRPKADIPGYEIAEIVEDFRLP